jgi:hypothetical protein
MFSGKRLQLLKETTPGIFNPTAVPKLMQSLKTTYQNNPTFDKGMPQGYNAASWAAMIELTVGLNNTLKPDYNEMDILLNMMCGEPVADTGTANQVTNTYGLPLSGARNIATYTAEFGIPTQAEQMRYSLLQSLDMTITRGNAPAIDGNANMIFLKPGNEDVYMSAGTNEEQSVTITGTPTDGDFTLTYGADTTAAIPYNATADQVQAALEAIDSVGEGNVVCQGGPLPATAVNVFFVGKLASQSLALMTADDSGLIGGTTPAVAIAQVTDGAAGDFTLDTAMPMLPQHFTVRKADTLAGLDTASALGEVHKVAITHSGLANPFMFFDEGDITADAHVDGDAPVHTITVTMANKITGDCQALKDAAQASPSTPSWWEIRATHPDGITQYKVQFYGAIGEPIEKTAVDNVYSVDFPLLVLINDELTIDSVESIMRFIVTTKTA